MTRISRFAAVLFAVLSMPAFGLPDAEIHAVTNGVFEGVVTNFPVIFTGAVTKTDFQNPKVRFVANTSGFFRVSMDSMFKSREPVAIDVITNGVNYVTLIYESVETNINSVSFEANVTNEFIVNFGNPKWSGLTYQYALGIGLSSVQVKFDPVNWNWGNMGWEMYNTGLYYTLGMQYVYLPEVEELNEAEFIGWGTSKACTNIIHETDLVTEAEHLYAQWRFNYCVKYYSDFVPAKTNSNYFIWDEPDQLSSNEWVRAGYTFSNWTNEVGETFADKALVTNLVSSPGEVCYLHAVWSNNVYSIVFTNGCPTNVVCSGEMESVKVSYDIPKHLPTNAYRCVGYHFSSWNWEETSTNFEDGALVSNLTTVADDEVLLKAIWEPNDYWAKFDANGGAGQMPNQKLQYDAEEKLDKCVFSRNGFCFAGWSTNKNSAIIDFYDCASVTNLTDVYNGTNLFYAVWTNATSATSFHVEGTSFATALSLAKNSEILFSGTVQNGGTNEIVITNSAANVSLRVSIDPQGGVRVGTNLDVRVYALSGEKWSATEPLTLNDMPSNIVSMTFTSKGVYRFVIDGKNLSNEYAYTLGIGLDSAQIIFDPQGKVFDDELPRQNMSNFNFTVGSSIGYLPNVISTNEMRFVGWFDAEIGGNEIAIESVVNDEMKFIYAQWRPAWSYVIAYTNEASDVIGTMTNEVFVYDCPQALCSNKFSRAHYNFVGWTNSAVNMVFNDGQIVSNLTSVSHSTNYMFAVWSPMRYFINYLSNGASGAMPIQSYYYGELNYLDSCTFGKFGYKFKCWTNEVGDTFCDGAIITSESFFSKQESTNVLGAVWTQRTDIKTISEITESGNEFFTKLSDSIPYAFHGSVNSSKNVSFKVVSKNNGEYRVSIDPVVSGRSGATLTIARVGATNETVTTVTDLSSHEVRHQFVAGQTNLFTVTCSTDYEFAVGIGRPGEQIVFYPNGGEITAADEAKGLTFNWTVGDPYCYMPELISATTNGTFNGWYLDPHGYGEEIEELDVVEQGVAELYAGWKGRSNETNFYFYWNHPSTNLVVTNCFSISTGEKFHNLPTPVVDGAIFIGWSTNKESATEFGFAKDGYIANGDLIPTNRFEYYAQWNGDFDLESDGQGGWRIIGFRGEVSNYLHIPEKIGTMSVTEIGTNAFAGVDCEYLVMPKSIRSIGQNAFENCSNLVSVTMPLVTPLSLVFPHCYDQILMVNICDNADICDYALAGCEGLTTIKIPSSVTSVGEGAFASCTGLKNLSYPTDQDSEFLNGTVTIGAWAFSNCTALVDIELPLGLTDISEGTFYRCDSLGEYRNMPYTVKTIGAGAFEKCANISNIIITEHVEEIGSRAFADCPVLKYVYYMGNAPTVENDIYESSCTNIDINAGRYVRSGCLSTASNWPEDISTGRWPEGTKHHVVHIGQSYYGSKYTIYYNTNSGNTTSEEVPVTYFNGRVLGSQWGDWGVSITMPTCEWWTARRGGKKVSAYQVVDADALKGTGKITYYGHWSLSDNSGSSSEEEEDGDQLEDDSSDNGERKYEVGWGDFLGWGGFYEDEGTNFVFASCTFDGILVDGEVVKGKLTMKIAQGKVSNGVKSAKFNATFEFIGSKKVSISGIVQGDEDGNAMIDYVDYDKDGNVKRIFSANLSLSGITSGEYSDDENGSYTVHGARNRFGQKAATAKTVVKQAMLAAGGNWNVILKTDAEEANGYSVLSISIGNNGKAKITGTMADGTKVSVASNLIVGDGCACLPVMIPLYTGKKGGFSFALWFTWDDEMGMQIGEDDGCSINGLSDWKLANGDELEFSESILARVIDNDCAGEFTMSNDGIEDLSYPEGTEIEPTLLPEDTVITMYRNKWSVPKADKVKFDDGEWVNDTDPKQNPAALKLTYTPKTGIFKGRFSVYAIGKKKKYTANVIGALACIYDDSDDWYYCAYGTAIIKNVGSVPIIIETIEIEE